MKKKKQNWKIEKIYKNIKNINWKLILIDNTIKEIRKQILCKEKKIYNGDPIEILNHLNGFLMHNKIKEKYAIWKKHTILKKQNKILALIIVL